MQVHESTCTFKYKEINTDKNGKINPKESLDHVIFTPFQSVKSNCKLF